MCLGDYHPFTQPWNLSDEEQELEYLVAMKALSVAESIVAELDYGDGNVEMPQEDGEWAEQLLWGWP